MQPATLHHGGGATTGEDDSSEVEMLSSGAFVDLPPLSCGGIHGAAAIAVDESNSAAGQVLSLGGADRFDDEDDEYDDFSSTVHLVDLATGACVEHSDLLHSRVDHAAARLPDGRIICAGGGVDGGVYESSAEVWGPPEQGRADAAWTRRELPAMSIDRYGCCGCVMSDGRFAVLGGKSMNDRFSSSGEAPTFGDVAHWEPLAPMHNWRMFFACGAVGGCVIVAGGIRHTSAEVYDESRNRWLRLPKDLPYEDVQYEAVLYKMGSALL
jgi:hypothetical protein